MLREMVVHRKQQSECLETSTKPTVPSIPLSSTSSEKLVVSVDRRLQRPDPLKISISKLPLDSSDNLLMDGHLAIPCILKLN